MRRLILIIALVAFVMWESYWAYTFVNAPIPDENMDTVAALLMAVFLPGLIGAILLISWIVYKIRQRN